MAYCGQATSVNCFHTHIRATVQKCKRWDCPDCRPDQCRILGKKAHAGQPDMFMTLTVNPAFGESPQERAIMLRDALRTIVTRAKTEDARPLTKRPGWKQWKLCWPGYSEDSPTFRKRVQLYNGKLPFTVVVELTENGEPHFHLLLRAKWIDWKWLKAQLEDLTGAWVIDVQRIWDPEAVAAYVSKYIGKGPHKFEGMKRHWRTRDYIIHEPDEDDEPVMDKPITWRHLVTLPEFVEPYQRAGYPIDWRGNSAIIRPP